MASTVWRVRERLWGEVKIMIEGGNAVIAWSVPNDSGFTFECIGENRREPVDFDGLTLVQFKPPASGPVKQWHPLETHGDKFVVHVGAVL